MKNIIYLFITICLLGSTNLLAHSGGHYHKEDGKLLNTWRLKSGELVKGNFSFAKDDRIFLEQEGGLISPIYINDLSIQDQKLAKFKIVKLLQINDAYFNNDKDTNNHTLKYLPLFIFSLLLWIVYSFNKELIRVYIFNSRLGFTAMSVLFIFSILMACSKSATTNSDTPIVTPIVNLITVTIPKTSSAFMDSAFAAFKPSISTSSDNNYFYIASTGIPSHNMMIGITNWQQQVPIAQPYTGTNHWSIPLAPVYAATPVSTKTNFMKGAVALAVNGVPIFNALNNRGEDSFLIGELDQWGGHCGKGDDYHYHAAPLHLSATSGLKPIAFALDGFAVYGAKEPDGSTMKTLDESHGHVGSNSVYHYHGTNDYPYVVGSMKGKVNVDPSTPAPENQIIPQAFSNPLRPALTPLNGASITAFSAPTATSYLLTYKIGVKTGSVQYSWTTANLYTFTFTDVDGKQTNSTYQRK